MNELRLEIEQGLSDVAGTHCPQGFNMNVVSFPALLDGVLDLAYLLIGPQRPRTPRTGSQKEDLYQWAEFSRRHGPSRLIAAHADRPGHGAVMAAARPAVSEIKMDRHLRACLQGAHENEASTEAPIGKSSSTKLLLRFSAATCPDRVISSAETSTSPKLLTRPRKGAPFTEGQLSGLQVDGDLRLRRGDRFRIHDDLGGQAGLAPGLAGMVPIGEVRTGQLVAQPPRLPDPLIVTRRVSVRGAIMIGSQKIQVGLSHARKTAEVTVEADTYQITVEPGITITAPRTTSRDVRRHKASNYA